MTRLLSTAFAVVTVLTLAAWARPEAKPSLPLANAEGGHEDLVHRWSQAVNRHDLEMMDQLMADDYVWHLPGGDVAGLANVKMTFKRLFEAFPDLQLVAEDILSDGQKVVVRWSISGTHRGEYRGAKPSNKRVRFASISIDQVADGKFKEGWEVYDRLNLFEQLGFKLVAPPG